MTPGPFDAIIVGSGVAGLTAALRLVTAEPGARVAVVAKADLSSSATAWAQGGVAAVLDDDEISGGGDGTDSEGLHVADTLAAGAGLCDRHAVEVLTSDGPERVRELVGLGARFDRDRAGDLELAREGGHSAARVVHAGGAATGAEVARALVDAVRAAPVTVIEGCFATDLIVEGGRCRGVSVIGPDGATAELRAEHTVLATGGAGQLFAVTTNPATSTGDGLAMALRAGVAVADVEFVQFHPTALHHPVMPRPLLSEALRGEGALLRDQDGARFVDELAPRDVVSRAMTARMLEAGTEHLWLDVTGVLDFTGRFASLAAAVRAAGLDPERGWLPVAPAAHYLCGGVLTDLDGATTLPGLWVAGEVACSGVHGANRLASNSLLEGLVFAARAVDAMRGGMSGPRPTGALAALLSGGAAGGIGARRLVHHGPLGTVGPVAGPVAARAELGRAMSAGAGVLRSAGSLAEVGKVLDDLAGRPGPPTVAGHEVANLVTVGRALVAGAAAREESRGAHARRDFPHLSADLLVRLVS